MSDEGSPVGVGTYPRNEPVAANEATEVPPVAEAATDVASELPTTITLQGEFTLTPEGARLVAACCGEATAQGLFDRIGALRNAFGIFEQVSEFFVIEQIPPVLTALGKITPKFEGANLSDPATLREVLDDTLGLMQIVSRATVTPLDDKVVAALSRMRGSLDWLVPFVARVFPNDGTSNPLSLSLGNDSYGSGALQIAAIEHVDAWVQSLSALTVNAADTTGAATSQALAIDTETVWSLVQTATMLIKWISNRRRQKKGTA